MRLRFFFASVTVLLVFGVVIGKSFAVFQDVSIDHAYQSAIDFVQSQGIVKGYPDGSFQPDRLLNRAEFTKIIVESRFPKTEIEQCLSQDEFYKKTLFSDVEPAVWFEKYVCVAKRREIIGGYPDGTFRPVQSINFAEASKILVGSYGLNAGVGEPWYEPFVTKLEGFHAIPVTLAAISDPFQRALREISRAEMAGFVYQLRVIDDSVASEDGSFSVTIPESSLPDGISLSEISVTRIPSSEGSLEEVHGAPMVFYRLEPSGIQFKEPVTFEINAPTLKNTIPIIFLVSGEVYDLIPSPMIEVDLENESASLTGDLAHFSELVFVPAFRGSISGLPKINAVGNEFILTVDISRIDPPVKMLHTASGTTFEIIREDWSISNGVFRPSSDALSPAVIVDSPAHLDRSPAGGMSQTGKFSCATATAEVSISYQVSLDFRVRVTKPGEPALEFPANLMASARSNTFECRDPAIDAVPTIEPPTLNIESSVEEE